MQKSLVRIAITLIAANAALAIVILLGGDMGDVGGRILGTSLLATGTAIVVMIQLPAAADRRLGPIPIIAIGFAVLGFVVVTAAIWSDFDSDIGWKLAGTAYTVAVGSALAALLAGIPITGAGGWVGNATIGAVALGSGMIVLALWAEIGNDGYWRIFAVVAVLVAAGGLAVPILGRSSSEQHLDMAVTHCPFCGADVGSQRASDASCPACGNRFGVTLHAVEISNLSSKTAG